ncbi:YhdP family protein [Ottowia sp.]|uniref:YhdP family phospholipid transporter n=1 Tax=Ottowia sp. TaxID=1898956 RepID=UPI003A8A8D5E
MAQFSIHFFAVLMRWALRGLAALALLAVLAWSALHWVIVPRIDDFRPRLQALASRAVGASVTIGAITAESNALMPAVSLHEVRIHDTQGQVGLRLPSVLVAFSVLSLAKGELAQLVIDQPDLQLRRTADGRLLVGGIDLSGGSAAGSGANHAAADWVFSQPELVLRGGRITWVDEQRDAPPVALQGVQVVLRNGRRQHQIRLDALPPQGWGEQRLTVIGQFRQPVFSRHAGAWRDWVGQVFVHLPRTDVSELRRYVDLRADWGADLREGRGALRAWAEVQRGAVVSATADLQLDAVSVSFGERLAPLAFANLGGRLGWRDLNGEMVFDTRNLHFVDAAGATWPGGNLALHYRDGRNGQAAGGQLRSDKLDLAALGRIALSLPLPDNVRERLQAHPLQGMVDSLSAHWDGALDAPRDWNVQARVSALSVGVGAASAPGSQPASAAWPSLEGAALEVTASRTGGQASLTVKDGAVTLPGVLEEPRIALDELNLKTRWRVQGQQIEADVDELNLRNADATGSFQAHWKTSESGREGKPTLPGVLDLKGAFSRANGARVHRYLPLVIPADARRYVRDAVQKGEARDFAVRIKGPLNDVPFDRQPAVGEFRFAGKVSGVTLAYVPTFLQPKGQAAWPALEGLSGELVFDRGSMQVRGATAKVKGHPGWQFTDITTRIADMEHARVQVQAESRGPLTAALGIVRQSPVSGFIDGLLDQATGTGDAALRLELDLPVDDIDKAQVDGLATLQGNDVRISPASPMLGQARGTVAFSQSGFTVQDAQVRMLGGDARISGGLQPEATSGIQGAPSVVLRASGTASAEALRTMKDWAPVPAIAEVARGSAAYEAVVGFHADGPDVLVTSDLKGITLDLPPPLDKAADAAWPLRYDARRQPAASGRTSRERVRATLADRLALDYELDDTTLPARVLRGAIGVGPQVTKNLSLPASGVIGQLQLPQLDVDAWLAVQSRLGREENSSTTAPTPPQASATPGLASRAYVPNTWALRVGELRVHERSLHDLVAHGAREGSTWRTNIQARELAGRIAYSEGENQRPGKVQARLTRLSVPEEATPEQTSLLTEPPSNMPALDIVVDDFELRDKKLGRLEVQAVNRDSTRAGMVAAGAGSRQDWQLNSLSLRTPEATFTASGYWAAGARAARPDVGKDTGAANAGASVRRNDARRTELDFDLDVRDAGALLTRLNMPGVLARGQGKLSGNIGWEGAPATPHYPSMQGQLRVDMGAGQFLKASPGIGKLLGVISLQALPRRLSMDFRDVFSSGFAFDFVRGDVGVQSGVAQTRNLQMKGVNAAVLMEGSADLDKETQNLHVLVVPDIDAGTAALAAAAINPVIGLGAFVAQLVLKEPINRAATREFDISGTWTDPQVTPADARERAARTALDPASAPVPANSAPTMPKAGEAS